MTRQGHGPAPCLPKRSRRLTTNANLAPARAGRLLGLVGFGLRQGCPGVHRSAVEGQPSDDSSGPGKQPKDARRRWLQLAVAAAARVMVLSTSSGMRRALGQARLADSYYGWRREIICHCAPAARKGNRSLQAVLRLPVPHGPCAACPEALSRLLTPPWLPAGEDSPPGSPRALQGRASCGWSARPSRR